MRNIAATLALLLAMTQAHGAPQQGKITLMAQR
jgi:hypothetical protein